MQTAFSNLNPTQINRLFPFYFVLDSSLCVCENGSSLEKIVDFNAGKSFFEHFRVMRPHLSKSDFETLLNLQNQLIVLQIIGKEHIKIRGQFECLSSDGSLLFVGSPWFNDIAELQSAGLSLFDFAFFDPLADLLQVLKNQEIATNDIKLLLDKIKQQKQALEKSTKELQENQTRLQLLSTIAEKTINGVIITDRKGRIEWVNDSFTHISGYTQEEVLGKKPGEILQGAETDLETVKYLSKQINLGQSFSCELLNYHKNGGKYWVKILGNPLVNPQGEVIGFFALEEDVTARVQTEQTLREAKEKSDAIAHSKNIFLTNMSHEMRTPLNAILGMGHQLKKTSLSEQQEFFLETMNTAAEHLMVVINDILDISKVDAGKLTLENIDFDIRALINRCSNVLMPKVEEKGLLFKVFIDDETANYLVGDPHRINQILLNLLGNAIKFTESGSVRLLVNCLNRTKTSQTLRFSIEDTGVGINERFISQLFTEFSQEDSSIVRKYGGTGLGLNITKKLVDLMDGKIEVQSRKNFGTTFNIELTLPIGNAANLLPEEKTDFDPIILKNKIILLVEDNEMNRILARTVLQNYQVKLIEVDNGKKAVELLKLQKVDLVLMDMQMPIMDGMAATHNIRENLKLDVPILALTANALKGEREKCLAAGMNDYISKPFREKELIPIICKLLGILQTPKGKTETQTEDVSEILYSFDYLNEVCDSDEEFIQEMVRNFAFEVECVTKEMPKLLEQNDFEQIKRMAHRIKSNLAMLEVNMGVQLTQQIELENSNNPAQMQKLINELIDLLQRVLPQMEKEANVFAAR